MEVVDVVLAPGQVLRVVGGKDALGIWDPQKGPELNQGDSDSVALIDMPPMSAGDEFKLIKTTGAFGVQWEPLEGNRKWPEVEAESVLTIRWGLPQITISAKTAEPIGEPPVPSSPKMAGPGSIRERFIVDSDGKIEDFFLVENSKIGAGAFGTVTRAIGRSTNDVRAVKTIAREKIKKIADLQKEIDITRKMDHPNIVRLFATFQDFRNIYIVMELCEGGELFDRIVEAGHLTELQASIIMEQIFRAVNYMHSQQVAHRDLKPENFLLVSKGPVESSLLKVIDFGLSRTFEPLQVMKSQVGTLNYAAPEVFRGRYTQACDLWSCGVILYCLLAGRQPFAGKTNTEVISRVKSGRYSLQSQSWNSVSDEAKDLIRRLLELDPMSRITPDEALRLNWIKSRDHESMSKPLHPELLGHLEAFGLHSRFQQAALAAVALQLDEKQLEDLRSAFVELDLNQDGTLSLNEMKKGLMRTNLQIPDDLKAIMEKMDTNADGVVSYSEFLAAATDLQILQKKDICWRAFKAFDRNNDGTISREELALVLKDEGLRELPGWDVSLDAIDTNHDGVIEFEEFVALLSRPRLPDNLG